MKLSELFTDESKWVKGLSCARRNGPEANFDSESPDCWCLVGGACHLIPDHEDLTPVLQKLRNACEKLFPSRCQIKNFRGEVHYVSVPTFNDHPDTTFADVQAVIREAESA